MFSSSVYSKENLNRYPEVLKRVINYVKENFEEIKNFENGTYEIDGKNIFMQVMEADTQSVEERRIESHRKYIDVQVVLKGKEVLGFCVDNSELEIVEEIEERDIIFYKGMNNETFIKAQEGCYNIFFPDDIHRPGVMYDEPMHIKKAVIKVLYSLI